MKPALVMLLLCGSAFAQYQSPQFAKTQAELDEQIAKWMPGYRAEGAPNGGRLEAFQPIPVELKRGRCYMMVLRLGAGATWSPHARAGVSFIYTPNAGGATINGGPGITGPGGIGSAGCPQATGAYLFDLQAIWGSATDKSRI